jgi:hypothetical protein
VVVEDSWEDGGEIMREMKRGVMSGFANSSILGRLIGEPHLVWQERVIGRSRADLGRVGRSVGQCNLSLRSEPHWRIITVRVAESPSESCRRRREPGGCRAVSLADAYVKAHGRQVQSIGEVRFWCVYFGSKRVRQKGSRRWEMKDKKSSLSDWPERCRSELRLCGG